MRLLQKLCLTFSLLLACPAAFAAGDGYDVFLPISKYIAAGDAESLSAWFADHLEVSILSASRDCSRNQAKQVLKAFFEKNKPRSFQINHTAARSNSKYALGNLNVGGETYNVTIFVSRCGEFYRIQLFKIEPIR